MENKLYRWVKASRKEDDVLNLPDPTTDVFIRYDNGTSKEVGSHNLIKDLYEGGWEDVEYLQEYTPPSLLPNLNESTQQLKSKYEKYVSNIQWHIDTNHPEGYSLAACKQRLSDYSEVIRDINSISPGVNSTNHVQPVKDQPDSFEEYMTNSRNAFIKEVGEQEWNTKLRTTAEDIIICFDQMRERLSVQGDGEKAIKALNDMAASFDKDPIGAVHFYAMKYCNEEQRGVLAEKLFVRSPSLHTDLVQRLREMNPYRLSGLNNSIVYEKIWNECCNKAEELLKTKEDK